jgi:glutamine synthetase
MSGVELVARVCCDLGAIVRGRSLPASSLSLELRHGVGWVPANQALTPIGPLAEPNPFGATGDLRLLPDIDTRARVAGDGAVGPLDLVLCDLVETDGRPWRCCPRQFLREALEQLRAEFGITVRASFEHEFQLLDDAAPALPFSLEAQRRAEPFAARLVQALLEGGLEPERVFPEYAPHQLEIPVAAAEGMVAADRSVVLREVVREVARRHGLRASFAPLLDPATAGNGVHIHLSLLDGSARPLLYDPARPSGLSAQGSSFAAGILRHARALSALTAPSPASGARLAPHRWSAGAASLGLRNREALLRIPALVELGGGDQAAQMRLEYRGADSSANPYLALGAVLRAGLEGLREGLAPPPLLERDPAELDAADAMRYGVGALPGTLELALEALATDATARGWIDPQLYAAYVAVKRTELDAMAGLELGEVCGRYAAIY